MRKTLSTYLAAALAAFLVLPQSVQAGGFSGGGGISDPIVPADGTLNVTGALTASGTITGNVLVSSGNVTMGASLNMGSTTNYGLHVTGGRIELRSNSADAIDDAVRIAAQNDLTSGTIFSVGDNNGTSYAEKFAVDFAGAVSATGNITVDGTGVKKFVLGSSTGSGTGLYFDAISAALAIDNDGTQWFIDLAAGSNHGIRINTPGTKAACTTSATRKVLFVEASGLGTQDKACLCVKKSDDSYA